MSSQSEYDSINILKPEDTEIIFTWNKEKQWILTIEKLEAGNV